MSYLNLSRQSTPSKVRVPPSILSGGSHVRNSSSRHTTINRPKKKKVAQSALVKRGLVHVVDDQGVDRTPKLLNDPEYQVLEEWQPTVLDYVEADLTSQGSQVSLARNFQQSAGLSYGSRASHTMSLQMSFTNIANVESFREPTKHGDEDTDSGPLSEERLSETVASAFRLRYVPSREFHKPHSKVHLVARETPSFTLFSLTSKIESVETPLGKYIQAENEHYEYITVGRGKYSRKINTSEQQTPSRIKTTQASLLPKYLRRNNWTWTTIWKIYDEYMNVVEEKKNSRGISVEEQWGQLTHDNKFLDTIRIIERLLGVPTYREVQLTYKGKLRSDPCDLNAQFLYTTQTLWAYSSEKVQNKAVSAISINRKFPDIIAVGYGKFQYKEPDKGYICIWCVKNPLHPERCYRFSSPVTCLDFADWSPNVLAAGYLDGSLLVLDITSHTRRVLYSKDAKLCSTYSAVASIKWWIVKDIYAKQEERLMMTTEDGRIFQLRRRHDILQPFQMMRCTKTEGKVKGIDCLRRCDVEEIPMIRFPAARGVVRYPEDDNVYLVPADDGSVHKCSVNFFTQHLDVFLAHSGPVYALKFSPFCQRIFLTCGADGAVRLWAWDIFEPLITMTTGPIAVLDAAWSPSNSTIIASISGPCLCLWDLRRKTYYPASTIYHATNANYCTLKFTPNGDNIIIGDVEGNVHVMGLVGMPFNQIYKEDILAASIEKELIVKPYLLKLLRKTGPPFTPL